MVKLTRAQELALIEFHRFNFFAISSIGPAISNELSSLERTLNEAIARIGGVAFVKCGRKSCMDFAMRIENGKSKKEVESFVFQAESDLVRFGALTNQLCDVTLNIWCQSMAQSLSVATGFDALQNISHSMLASCALNPAQGSTLFVRQYVEMDPCLQFRAFVYNNTLTAITQKYAIYSPWLSEHATSVTKKLSDFVEKRLIPSMNDRPSFGVDLAVFPDRIDAQRDPIFQYRSYEKAYKFEEDPHLEIRLLQLHPLYPRAVIGLFEWSADHKILTSGPFEARYRLTPTKPSSLKSLKFERGTPLIARAWLEHMENALKSRILNKRLHIVGKAVTLALLLLTIVFIAWKI